MRVGRRAGWVALAAIGLLITMGCEPPPPAAPPPPAFRTITFVVTQPGPLTFAFPDPTITLTDRRPDVFPAGDCDPVSFVDRLQLGRRPYTAPEDGRTYDTWWLDGGSMEVVIPGSPECLPDAAGEKYGIVAFADAFDSTGREGSVVGVAVDEHFQGLPSWVPKFRTVK
jgi:hypothetical protein